MKFIKLSLLLFLVPLFTNAQYLNSTRGILNQLSFIVSDLLIPLAFAVALLLFFWGVAQYIRSEGQGKDDGKRVMVWGIVALFVMSSVWGLVYLLRDEIGVGSESTMPLPIISR